MTSLTGESSLVWHAESLVPRIFMDCGNSPAVFIDTGAVIEAERFASRHSCRTGRSSARTFFEIFDQAGIPLYTTDGILKEVIDHSDNHRYQGRPEISSFVRGWFEDVHCRWVKRAKSCSTEVDPDAVAYEVYLAGHSIFYNGHKKRVDAISLPDRALITEAICAKHMVHPGQNPYSGIGIVTTDSHITETVDLLKREGDRRALYGSVRAYPLRF